MRYLYASALTLFILTLGACSDRSGPAPIDDTVAPDIILAATHDIEAPEPITHVSFAPKDGMLSFLGFIGLIGQSGDFYTTNIEGTRVTKAPGGGYISSIGLSAPDRPSIFLLTDKNGGVTALIEGNDLGDMEPMVVSGAPEVKRFCNGPAIDLEDGVQAVIYITPSGEAMQSSFLVEAETAIRFTNNAAADDDQKQSCGFSMLSEQWSVKKRTDTQLLAKSFGENPSTKIMAIGPGLSINGLETLSGVHPTSASFGGVGFKDGIIAVPDLNSGRIIILSRSYVLAELDKAAQ